MRDMSTKASNGYLWVVARTTSVDTLGAYRSTDGGSSWTLMSSFTHTGLQEWAGFFVDTVVNGHLIYRVNSGTADLIYYRRFDMPTNSWGGFFLASATDLNGGVAGSRWQGLDVVAWKPTTTGNTFLAWTGGYSVSSGSGPYGIYVASLYISPDGSVYNGNSVILKGTRTWTSSQSGRYGPSIDLEHNGSGVTNSTPPNLWVSWGRTALYMVKMTWNNNGWTGPSTATTLAQTIPTHNYIPARWDGKRFLIATINNSDTTSITIYERNQANTSTTIRTTPSHPTGVITNLGISYDNVNRNIRVYAVGTSTSVLYFVDYNRNAGTWGTWATVTATAVLTGSEWGARRGGSYGNSRFDVVTVASGAPNTISNLAQTISNPPNIPTWNTSGQAYVNGGPANVGATLPLVWNFTDPDSGQTQGSYAISRSIGGGTLSYWQASTSTWVATEVQNTSAVTSLTLASGWAAATDANYQYKVKVWDSTGTPSTGYSAALTITPSTPINPTVSAPTNASTISTDHVTVTWTVAEQSGIRAKLTNTGTGTVVYDSGAMMGYTGTSFQVPVTLATSTSWSLDFYTYNLEQLPSTVVTRTFSVAYPPPPPALSTLVPDTTNGVMAVTPAALAAVGAQPTIVGADLYRRVQTSANLVVNGSIVAGSTTGWAAMDSATLTASTTQFRSGTHSLRMVPNGVGANPRAQVPFASALAPTASLQSTNWTAGGWIRPDTALKSMQVRLVYYDAGGTELGIVSATYTNPVATAWTWIEVTGNAAAFPTAVRVGMAIGEIATPAATDAFYVDEMLLRPANTDVGVRLFSDTALPATYNDWGAAHGLNYEYQWVTKGSNGTSMFGPWVS
jgi:hypothetical protein